MTNISFINTNNQFGRWYKMIITVGKSSRRKFANKKYSTQYYDHRCLDGKLVTQFYGKKA